MLRPKAGPAEPLTRSHARQLEARIDYTPKHRWHLFVLLQNRDGERSCAARSMRAARSMTISCTHAQKIHCFIVGRHGKFLVIY